MRIPKPKRSAKVRKPIKRGKRPNRKRKTSRGKMGRTADALFARIVKRSGLCDNGYRDHVGGLQCAHLVSRSYRSVRWDEDNAVPLCAGCHTYYTHHPLEWEDYVILRNGDDAFSALKRRAKVRWDGDIEGVLVRLAARAVSLNLEPK